MLVPVDLCFTKRIRFSLSLLILSESFSLSSFVRFKEEKLILFIIFRVIASKREGRDEESKKERPKNACLNVPKHVWVCSGFRGSLKKQSPRREELLKKEAEKRGECRRM